MPGTSPLHKTTDALMEAQDALANALSYDSQIIDLISAGVCSREQAEDTLISMQNRLQTPYSPDLWQLKADLLIAKNNYVDAKTAAEEERTLLMHEAHHRVKNSLQLVISLLNMQARQAVNNDVARQLSESAARVRVIGSLHNRLYQTDGTQKVEIKPYLMGLVDDLRTRITTLPNRRITLEAEPALWNAADMLALGLILTELVTNALKYGSGNVEICFRHDADGHALLIVEDDGKLPIDFDLQHMSGFGIKLVQTLVRQRGGSLTIDRTVEHTRFSALMPHSRVSANPV